MRANENVELTSMHTLFVREHNRLAGQIAAANPGMSDEQIYQRARSLVIGELQAITYNEWLPAMLGPNGPGAYRGYNPNVNPGIANEFSTAGFRLHSTINDDVEFFGNDGRPLTFTYVNAAGETVTVDGEVSLAEAFNNPNLLRASGVNGILKYAASTHMEELDMQVVDSLRNFLFVQLAGGLDLASLNIQRGRDHGLADYNTARAAYGLPRVTSFDQITSDVALQQKLRQLYGSVNNIDLWVGGLAEDHLRGGSAGPLVTRILADQFSRLRGGDRLWYQRNFSGRELDFIDRTTLADVIERNTGVRGLQDNVFVFQAKVQGQVFLDVNGNGLRDRTEQVIGGVKLELLNDEGVVIATTRTDRNGSYTFDQFPETGDFQVRVVLPTGFETTTDNPLDILISTGDVSLRGKNFGIRRMAGFTSLSVPELFLSWPTDPTTDGSTTP